MTEIMKKIEENNKEEGIIEKLKGALEDMGCELQYNDITRSIELNGEELVDEIEHELVLFLADRHFKKGDAREGIRAIAYRNKYHPIKQYFSDFESTTSTENIERLLNCLDMGEEGEEGEEGEKEITKRLFVKWLVGVVARVFEHGRQNVVLVLEGEQRIGKSSLTKWLCPHIDWYSDNTIDTNNKDSLLEISSTLIWELSELERVTTKRDASELKSFISTQKIRVRAAYGRNQINRQPLASFIATTNNNTFFNDVTGNYRYISLYVKSIDFSYTDINRDALWQEIVSLYRNNFDCTLSEEEKEYQERTNEAKMVQDSFSDYISKVLVPAKDNFVSNVDLFEKLSEMNISVTSNDRRIKDAMKRLGYVQKVKRINGRAVRGYTGCAFTGEITEAERQEMIKLWYGEEEEEQEEDIKDTSLEYDMNEFDVSDTTSVEEE